MGQITKTQNLSALDLIQTTAEKEGEPLDESVMKYGEVFIVIWYKSLEIATKILQPPKDVSQEAWNQALEKFLKTTSSLSTIINFSGRPINKKTLAFSLFVALVEKFITSNGLNPSVFDEIASTCIEGAKKPSKVMWVKLEQFLTIVLEKKYK